MCVEDWRRAEWKRGTTRWPALQYTVLTGFCQPVSRICAVLSSFFGAHPTLATRNDYVL